MLKYKLISDVINWIQGYKFKQIYEGHLNWPIRYGFSLYETRYDFYIYKLNFLFYLTFW